MSQLQPPFQNQQQLLTTIEVARLLRISVGGLNNRLSKDPQFIPHFKVGKNRRFDRGRVMEHFGISDKVT